MLNNLSNKSAFKQVDKNSIKGYKEIEKYIRNSPTFCMRVGCLQNASLEEKTQCVQNIYNSFVNSFTSNWADLSNPVVSKCFEKAIKSNLTLATSKDGNGDVVVAVDDEYNMLSINCNGVSINCRALENNNQSIIAVVCDVIDFTKKSLTAEELNSVYPFGVSNRCGVDCVIYNRDNALIECNTLEKHYVNNSGCAVMGNFTLTQKTFESSFQEDGLEYKNVQENLRNDSYIYAYICKDNEGNIQLDNSQGLMYLNNIFKDDLKWSEYGFYINMPIESLAQGEMQDVSSCQ